MNLFVNALLQAFRAVANETAMSCTARAAVLPIPRARELYSAATNVFTQLQYSQANREKLGIIVNANGEAQGIVTGQYILRRKIGTFPP